ncbi:MAG TPA: gamma-glutamyltransferase family protein [Actinomycetota bacterium]|nr:gamma-glutamyltransferase family protein [Actinomycetota bacterium]
MFATRPELRGSFGMVSSTHWLASATGMAVLERGGNAFDAAVAAGFVLQVVEPHLNGPGGEVPILAAPAGTGRVLVVNGQGPVPAAATIGRFAELGLDLIPGTGLLPACVPGAFGAWMLLLRDHGTFGPRDVLEPAIGYAEAGFPAVPRVGAAIGAVASLFRDEWPSSAEVWLAGGIPAPGGRLRNPALAATWHRLLDEAEAAASGRDGQIEAATAAFYDGFVAETIDRFLATAEVMDVSGRRHKGLLTGDDLHGWRAGVEEPVSADHHGWTVCKTGPWGQGPVFLQQLRLLEGFDLEGMGLAGADWVHTVTECAKLAFADREAWYGDPAGFDVPLDGLLDPAYAAERRAMVADKASLELRPGSPAGRVPRLASLHLEPGAGEVLTGSGEPTFGDTCHVDVADRHGNLVAATPSGGWLQSSPVVPGLGFCLGTRGQMCWLEEGLAASLRPGTRPRTTLSPSMALRDGEPVLAFGTPGGDGQDQWSLQFFLAHARMGLDLQAAIDTPSFLSEHFPSSFWPRQADPGRLVVEARHDPGVVEELRARGHLVELAGPWSLGRTCAAGRDPASGFLVAAANPRGRQAYAAGR